MKPQAMRAIYKTTGDKNRGRQPELLQDGISELVVGRISVIKSDGHRAIRQREAILQRHRDLAQRSHLIVRGQVAADLSKKGDGCVQIRIEQPRVVICPQAMESENARLSLTQSPGDMPKTFARHELNGLMIEL